MLSECQHWTLLMAWFRKYFFPFLLLPYLLGIKQGFSLYQLMTPISVCVCMSGYMWWWCLGEGNLDEVVIFILLPFISFLSYKAIPFYRWKHWISVNRKSFLPDDSSRQTSLQTRCLSSQEAFCLVTMGAVVQWVLRLILKQVMCPSWCSDPNMRQRL